MRRPLKPFVTEYKGATRRQASPASQPLKLDSEPPEPRQLEPRQLEGSRSVPPPQEDSYEAALRAADALFAPSPRPNGAPRANAEAPIAPSADAMQPPDEGPASPVVSGLAPPNGGRILRVIDEPPSPELLRLEAERAPKRRGRKPGSKNKPKVAAVVEAIPAIPAPSTATAPREDPEPVMSVGEDVVLAPEAATAALPPRVYRLPAARPATEATRDGKYAWVRTKLKPGERWKRRLPKVAW